LASCCNSVMNTRALQQRLLVAACSLVGHVVGGAAVFVLSQSAVVVSWCLVYAVTFCVCCRQSDWTAIIASCVAECWRLRTL
jgi:hypothetical protein